MKYQILNVMIDKTDKIKSQYCLCKLDIPDQLMVFCENPECKRGIWFHTECIGVTAEEAEGNDLYVLYDLYQI